jgi:hypothetical protein
MHDGLQGTDDRGPKDMGPVPGALSKDQQDWVMDALPKWKKPVFVCSHFPVHELKAGGKPLDKLLVASPKVAGYIHGHDHRWYTKFMRKGWAYTQIKRTLCLPSTGHWGDIGYVLFRELPDRFVATCVQKDFYFPSPRKPEARPAVWDAIAQEHNGQYCTFMKP